MKNLSLRNKILLAMLTLALMVGLVAFQGITALNRLMQQIDSITQIESEKVMLSQMMRVHLVGMNRAENNVVTASEIAQIDRYQASFEDYAEKFENHLLRLQALIEQEDKDQLNTLQENHAAYVRNFKHMLSFSRINPAQQAQIILRDDMADVLVERDKVSRLIQNIAKNKLSAALEENNIDVQEVKKRIAILIHLAALEKNTSKALRALQYLLATAEIKRRGGLKQEAQDFLQNAVNHMEQLVLLFEHSQPGLAHNLRSVMNHFARLQAAALELSEIHFNSQVLKESLELSRTLIDKVEWALKDISHLSHKSMQHALHEAEKLYSRKKNQLAVLAVVALLLGLGIAFFLFNSIANRIKGMISFAEAMSKDKYPQSLSDPKNDELSALSQTLNILNRRFKETLWTKTGYSELSATMRGETHLKTLAQKIINYLAPYLHAQVGVFYLSDQGENTASAERFHLLSSYAYRPHDNAKTCFALGEGLVGQAAQEKKSIVFDLVDSAQCHLVIDSGLGAFRPSHIFVLPLIFNGQVLAVLELGSSHVFTPVERAYLEQVAEGIAISLNMAMNQSQTQRLLQHSQKQAQTLKVQEEAVREKNVALQQAKVHLEEKAQQLALTSRYKSEFLANMSHELRTPLNSLLLFAHSLMENETKHLDQEELESAVAIHESGLDLLNLINEILDLAQIEAGKIKIQCGKVSLQGLAQDIEHNFSPQAQQKGLDLSVEVDNNLPEYINSDRQRLKQILNNLMANALKFTPQGLVQLRIYRPQEEQLPQRYLYSAQHSIAFSVSDTGIGIPEDKQRLIFEAFQQADSSSNRQYGGVGLGLSISRELAYLLGGAISLQSQVLSDTESGGSTFTLYLPEQHRQEKGEPLQPSAQQQKIRQQNQNIQQGYRLPVVPFSKPLSDTEHFEDDRYQLTPDDKTLLIIEDDINFVKFITALAHEKGFKVLSARDGETGLTFAHEYQPKAIILDIGLPQLDGWTVMDELKSTLKTRHIPVYFISVEEENWNAMYMGAIGFLTKPVDQQQLELVFQKIDSIISKTFKSLLLALSPNGLAENIMALIGNSTVETTISCTAKETLAALKSKAFDCMVLDLHLPDMSGFDVLTKSHEDRTILLPPVLIYTGKPLSPKDEKSLQNYPAQVIKGIGSENRLVAEISLFLHRSEAELSTKQKAILKQLYNDTIIFEGKTILIVDDNARNMIAISHLLKAKGFKVRKAFDGREALKALARYPEIDAVLMDIIMPNMDGYEALQEIRKQEKFAHLPLIALTAKAMKASKESCLAAGADDYLSKPVNPLKLFSRLRFWLSQADRK